MRNGQPAGSLITSARPIFRQSPGMSESILRQCRDPRCRLTYRGQIAGPQLCGWLKRNVSAIETRLLRLFVIAQRFVSRPEIRVHRRMAPTLCSHSHYSAMLITVSGMWGEWHGTDCRQIFTIYHHRKIWTKLVANIDFIHNCVQCSASGDRAHLHRNECHSPPTWHRAPECAFCKLLEYSRDETIFCIIFREVQMRINSMKMHVWRETKRKFNCVKWNNSVLLYPDDERKWLHCIQCSLQTTAAAERHSSRMQTHYAFVSSCARVVGAVQLLSLQISESLIFSSR